MQVRKMEVVTIDRHAAQRMLEEFPYMRQRDLNSRQVEFYAEQMSAGLWQPFSDIEVVLMKNGDGSEHSFLVNGQHRLYAVIEADVAVDFVVKTVAVENETELGQRYGTIDIGRVRSTSDFARAIDLGHELGFKEYYITQLTSALTAIENQFKRSGRYSISPFHKMEMVRDYAKEGRQYFTLTAGGVAHVTRQMRRAFPLAVALCTLRESTQIYGEDKVRRFWSGIAFDNGLQAGDPRKVANRHFLEVALGAATKGARISPTYTARYIANCFNAYVEDRELKQSRVVDPIAPIDINGTKFKGK